MYARVEMIGNSRLFFALCRQLGLRFGVVDDELGNPRGDLSRSKGASWLRSSGLPKLQENTVKTPSQTLRAVLCILLRQPPLTCPCCLVKSMP